MKESQVQRIIYQEFITKSDIVAVIPNIYFPNKDFEADCLAITDNSKTIEFEIKASKWDYLQDFRKKDKHAAMEDPRGDLQKIPNQFYFVCPEGLIDPNEVRLMGYAGLIWVYDKGMGKRYMKKMWDAPIIHQERLTHDRFEELTQTLASRIW